MPVPPGRPAIEGFRSLLRSPLIAPRNRPMSYVRLRAATALILTMATLLPLAPNDAFAAPEVPQLQKMSSRFAPVDIRVDLSALPENERQALARIIQAAQV